LVLWKTSCRTRLRIGEKAAVFELGSQNKRGKVMACGVPVVCSREASLSEVAGTAALFVDPRAPEDLAAALLRVIGDEPLATDLRHEGLKRPAMFTPGMSLLA
jgi:glycosyltransferase involved in cell wall biosynthesis